MQFHANQLHCDRDSAVSCANITSDTHSELFSYS